MKSEEDFWVCDSMWKRCSHMKSGIINVLNVVTEWNVIMFVLFYNGPSKVLLML